MPEVITKFFAPIQLIGYVGTACSLISYQCRKNRNYFLFQAGCGLSFALQFALLHSYAESFSRSEKSAENGDTLCL